MSRSAYAIGQWVVMQETGDPAKIAAIYPGEIPRLDVWVVTETDHEGEVVRLEKNLLFGYIARVIDDPDLIKSLELIKGIYDKTRKGAL